MNHNLLETSIKSSLANGLSQQQQQQFQGSEHKTHGAVLHENAVHLERSMEPQPEFSYPFPLHSPYYSSNKLLKDLYLARWVSVHFEKNWFYFFALAFHDDQWPLASFSRSFYLSWVWSRKFSTLNLNAWFIKQLKKCHCLRYFFYINSLKIVMSGCRVTRHPDVLHYPS